MVEKGFGDHTALIGNGRRRTYKELTDWSNRLAHALVEDFGVKPGNRVLIRSGNNPAMVAAWLAVTKAGAVAVNTMPLLRAGELGKIVDKAEVSLALTDSRIADELVACAKDSRFLKKVDQLRRHRQPRRRTRPRGAEQAGQVRGREDRPRRRGAARLHLGHHRRAQGHHALPPRPADHRRRLRQGGAGRHARRRVRRLAAARLHLRPRRPRHVPAALRRHRDAAGERLSRQHDRDHRDLQGHHQLHLAHRLPRHAGGDGQRRRPLLAPDGRVRRRDPARPRVRGLDAQDRQADPRRHRLHRASAHLHHQPARRRPGRRHRQAGGRLRGQDRRRRHEGRARRHHRPPRRARSHRLPLPRRRAPDQVRARRLEPHRRRLRARRRRGSSTSPPVPTT